MDSKSQVHKALGPLESLVMKVLWDHPESLSVRQVLEIVAIEKPMAYTTMMTTLDRLYKKGLLEREQDKTSYLYRAHVSRRGYQRRCLEHSLREAQELGQLGMMSAFVDLASEMDDALLDKLEALIKKKRADGDNS